MLLELEVKVDMAKATSETWEDSDKNLAKSILAR